jgi:hypothetical protein
VVIYVDGALFASALVASEAVRRPVWGPRRYGAALHSVKLIKPPISRDVLRHRVSKLKWAAFPRSITTVKSLGVASQIRGLVSARLTKGASTIRDSDLTIASLEELRARALRDSRPSTKKKLRMTSYLVRSSSIHLYVLERASGKCEGCQRPAPFKNLRKLPYLEPHHTMRMSDDGPDHPRHVIALCPTCHSRVQYSIDGDAYNRRLKKALAKIEPKN